MPTTPSSPSPRAIAPTAASLTRNAQRPRPTTPSSTTSSTSSLMMNLPAGLVVGARVFLPGSKAFGSVRFLGETSFQADTWVGVELDQPMGRNSGEVQGRKYFDCLPSHGIFVRPTNCIPLMEETLPQDEHHHHHHHHHQRTSLGPKANQQHKPVVGVGGTAATAATAAAGPTKQPRATTPSFLKDNHPRFSTARVSTPSPPTSFSSLPRVVKPIASNSRSPPSSTHTTHGKKNNGTTTSTPTTSTTTTTNTPNISSQNNDVKGNDKGSGISTPERLLSGGLLEEKLLVELLVEMVTNSELLQTKISAQVGDEVQQHARAEVKAVEEKLMREMQGMTSLVGERLQGLQDQIVQTMGTIAEKNKQQGEAAEKEKLQEKEAQEQALNAILEFASETKQRLLADMQERSDNILALRKLCVTEEEEEDV